MSFVCPDGRLVKRERARGRETGFIESEEIDDLIEALCDEGYGASRADADQADVVRRQRERVEELVELPVVFVLDVGVSEVETECATTSYSMVDAAVMKPCPYFSNSFPISASGWL